MLIDELIGDTIETCIKYGFSVNLLQRKSIEGCSGFVDDYRKKFSVAINRPDWLEIFVHESCHIDQFVEQDELWTDPFIQERNFMDSETYTEDEAETVFYKTMLLEDNCDRRAALKILYYDLDIDLSSYVQAANCYHSCYYYFWKLKCFYDPKHNPYQDDDVLQSFSSDHIMNPEDKWKENEKLRRHIEQYHRPLA